MNQYFLRGLVAAVVLTWVPAMAIAAPLHGLEQAEVKAHNIAIRQEVAELNAEKMPLRQQLLQLNAENKLLKADYQAGTIDKSTYQASRASNVAEIKSLRLELAPINSEISTLNALKVKGQDTNAIATAKIARLVQVLTAEIESQLAPQFNLSSQTSQITGALARSIGVNPANAIPKVQSVGRTASQASTAIGANQPVTLAMIASGETLSQKRVTLNVERHIQVDVSINANIARDVLSGDMDALARDLYANVVQLNPDTVANTAYFEGDVIIFSHS